MSELTSIQVSQAVKGKLKALKKPKESYETVILRLLEAQNGGA
jgi:predicted CopG family antitoxin